MARLYYHFYSNSSNMACRNVIFFRYLQIRHFISKSTTLTTNNTTSHFKILHRTHITPALKNKMDTNASPLCSKCNSETGNLIHCFWSCVKLQRYWSGIVKELCVIFGVPIELNPMCLLLGLPD
ncbi:hypothetical protein F7725_019078, partial [Dissostichus mawsoni]